MRRTNISETINFTAFSDLFASAIDLGVMPTAPLYHNTDVAMVQMGDMVDRGKFGKRCIFILTLVQEIIGWTTLPLYGNHDLFSMIGAPYPDLIHPEEDIDRAGGEITKGGVLWNALVRQSFLVVRLNGPRGLSMRSRLNPSTLFVHAGIDLGWFLKNTDLSRDLATPANIDDINNIVERKVRTRSPGHLDDLFNDPTSPLMTRKTIDGDADVSCAQLGTILLKFNVARIIVGHTPQRNRVVNTLCAGRLILTDVMISRWMTSSNHSADDMSGGQPSAVVIRLDSAGLLDSIQEFSTPSILSHIIRRQDVHPIPLGRRLAARTTTPMPESSASDGAPSIEPEVQVREQVDSLAGTALPVEP